MQLPFRKTTLLQGLALFLIVLWTGVTLDSTMVRAELGHRRATLTFSPVRFDAEGFAPYLLAGAWKVTSSDPRFGGVSALALDRGEFVALSDSGVVVRFARPAGKTAAAELFELPAGPGDPRFKVNRDSESLTRDPAGRGWWVGFETTNELWLYDHAFRGAIECIRFGRDRWPENVGLEGLASDGAALLLVPEQGTSVVELRGSAPRTVPILNHDGRISDAARLPSGGLMVIERHLTALGFSNALSRLVRTANGYRLEAPVPLGVGRLDNVEAMAAERLPGGGTRLWLMTDDNLQPPLRTLLIALDLPR